MIRLNLIKNQLNNKKELVVVENINKVVKIVTMNAGLNALSKELIDEVYQTLVKLDTDDETKVIILTGKGKAFAAGADIKTLAKTNYKQITNNSWFLAALENISYHITKPIIAAVNGVAFGGGFELALACDLIIASDKAIFGFPEMKLGLFPGAGGTQRLARLMGYHKAAEYILTSKNIPLDELKSFGVINDIVSHDQLINFCVKVAENISQFSIVAVYAAKKSLKMALETNLSTGLKTEKYLFESLFGTDDKNIGIEAFLNKKSAKFSDK